MDSSIFQTQWYTLNTQKSLDLLSTNKDGLTSEEIIKRRNLFGLNKLPDSKRKNRLLIFLEQFNDLLIIILIIAVIISVILAIVEVDTYTELSLEHFLDAIVIIIVLLFNAFIGFYQEIRAEKEVASLKSLIVTESIVIRNGKKERISQDQLVIGDIIELEAGQKIPADARLIESLNLQVIESSLTGESLPVDKNASKQFPLNVTIGDRTNMVFMGTTISFGKALAVITGIGENTEVGKIASLMTSVETSKTPLQQRLEVFGKQLGIGTLLVAFILVVFGFFAELLSSKGDLDVLKTLLDLTIIGVSLVVAAVPEGLPAVMVLVLALGIRKMAKQNTISKSLQAIESIGSSTFICTDKTGTLTQNKMIVNKFVSLQTVLKPNSITHDQITSDIDKLLTICSFANSSTINPQTDNNQRQEIGDPLDIAILNSLEQINESGFWIKTDKQTFNELPFDSKRKLMSTIHRDNEDKFTLYTKGAPDVLLTISDRVITTEGVEKVLEESMKNELYQVIDQLAIEGLKVIGCGYKSISESQAQSTLSEQYDFNEIENKVIFAGFVCLNDPPRPEVINAIADCKTAGIEVLMITGDHPNAALAIGKQINLVDQNETKTLTGLEIDKLNDDELSNRLEDTRILARVSPEHKLRVVQSLQRKGEIVAMTGDGVNDAPALRQADIGVAMGMSGTEAATEAADLILTDDNFATLVRAIEEGRSIQANIRKFIGYLLASNTGEVLLLIMTVFIIGFFAPSLIVELSVLNESQILYMNLVTDTFLAIAIGLERKNSSIMNYPPRNPKEPIIGRKTFLSIIYTGTYVGIINLGFFLLLLGEPSNWVNLTSKEIAYAQTMTMSLIIFMETFIALSYRSSESIFTMSIFSNRVFLLSFGLVYILHFILLYTPFFQILFKLVPLSLTDLIILFVISLVALVMEEFRKKVISS